MATREMAVINDSKTNDVYELRDKKLADAQVSTTPSDITVNSVVPVELEDGSCIKIKRDSLVQAFASVLNSNSQSTITTLFGADSNGNHANINMANLASVLSERNVGLCIRKRLQTGNKVYVGRILRWYSMAFVVCCSGTSKTPGAWLLNLYKSGLNTRVICKGTIPDSITLYAIDIDSEYSDIYCHSHDYTSLCCVGDGTSSVDMQQISSIPSGTYQLAST